MSCASATLVTVRLYVALAHTHITQVRAPGYQYQQHRVSARTDYARTTSWHTGQRHSYIPGVSVKYTPPEVQNDVA
jgi:hypothetical protein